MAGVRFSYYLNGPYTFHDEPIELGLRLVADAGFEGVLLSSTGGRFSPDTELFPREERASVRRMAASLNLQVVGVADHYYLTNAIAAGEPIWLRQVVDVARDLETRMVSIHMGDAAPAGQVVPDLWRRAVTAFKDAADYAAADGITIAIHGIGRGYLIESAADVLRFIADVGRPNAGWSAAPGHAAASGLDVAATLRTCGSSIVHVAMSDFRRTAEREIWRTHDWVQILGEGDLDLPAALGVLSELGYAGYVSAGNVCRRRPEDPQEFTLEAAVTRSMAALRAASPTR